MVKCSAKIMKQFGHYHEMFWAICSKAGEEFCEGTPDLVGFVLILDVSCVGIVPLGDGDASGSVLIVGFPGFFCTIWKKLDPVLELPAE